MPYKNNISLLFKALHENQMALAAAIEELAKLVGDRGSNDTVRNVYGALETLTYNQELIYRCMTIVNGRANQNHTGTDSRKDEPRR